MKKKQLKKKLKIAMDGLKKYQGFLIDGTAYADDALSEIDRIDNQYIQIKNECSKEIAQNIYNILRRELRL